MPYFCLVYIENLNVNFSNHSVDFLFKNLFNFIKKIFIKQKYKKCNSSTKIVTLSSVDCLATSQFNKYPLSSVNCLATSQFNRYLLSSTDYLFNKEQLSMTDYLVREQIKKNLSNL